MRRYTSEFRLVKGLKTCVHYVFTVTSKYVQYNIICPKTESRKLPVPCYSKLNHRIVAVYTRTGTTTRFMNLESSHGFPAAVNRFSPLYIRPLSALVSLQN